jgi:DHA2 family multidrug resistance protein
MTSIMIVGKAANRIDGRYLIATGLVLTATSLHMMTQFTTEMTSASIVTTGLIQGLGLGFIFPPLSTLTFMTLSPKFRNEGTALFSLMRNLGSSIGISMVTTNLVQQTQANHAVFSEHINALNQTLQQAVQNKMVDLQSSEGLAMVNALVTKEAATLAYLQDFRLMMWITLAALPLVLLLRKPAVLTTPT